MIATALALPRVGAEVDFLDFTFERVVIDPALMKFNPTREFIFPTLIKASEHLRNPLGTYYLYYAPHDNPGGICLAYADRLEGPWTEYTANPVIANDWPPHFKVAHASSPHVIWNREAGKFFVYFHGENDVTRVASSPDGVRFTYEKVCLTRADFDGVTEVSYARVYEHTIPSKGNHYTMLVMCCHGSNPGTRKIYLAWSDDGLNWTTQRTPLISPDANEAGQLSGPELILWKGRTCVAYHSSAGKMYLTEVGENFDQEKHLGVFHEPLSGPPDNKRSAAPVFFTEGQTMYMFYEAGRRGGTKIALAKSAIVPPAPPGKLRATATNSVQVDLTWSDGANNETGFSIERAARPEGPYVEVATAPAGATRHTDSGLSGDVTYHYRLRARNGAGNSAYAEPVAVTTPPGGASMIVYSIAAQDGWVSESAVDSGVGGTTSKASLRTGESKDAQLVSILSFDTSSIPEGATIVSATLRLRKSGGSGQNPFDSLGACLVDVKGATGFGDSEKLEGADLQAPADATRVAELSRPSEENGNLATGALSEEGMRLINTEGRTQFRIYFANKQDRDGGNDYLSWYAGGAKAEADRPALELSYLMKPGSGGPAAH